jgi:hypothetical protein
MEIKLNCTDALLSTDFLSIMAGTTATIATATIHMFEVKEITSTGSVTASREPISATGADKFVFKSTDGATIGSALLYTSIATAGFYQFTAADKRFSFDTATGQATGDTILIDYYAEVTGTRTISFTSEDFSDYYTLEGETLWRSNSDGQDYCALITADKVSLNDSFSIPGVSEGEPGTFDFEITVMKPSGTTELMKLEILE